MSRSAVLVTAVLGALAVTAAAIAASASGLGPFGSHRAGRPVGGDVPAIFEPGATVTHNSDGTMSVLGTIKADVAAERQQAGQLLDAGPQSITCVKGGPKLRCTGLADAQAVDALKHGVLVYQRTVHGGITPSAVAQHAPFFSPMRVAVAD